MHFTYLKLVNYKRFPLRDAEILEHEFNSRLTMIAGPNGAGKSSTFNELSPLPSNKSDFGKDGYKELHITKGNDRYVLICDFRNGTQYSFKLNGEELNTAGIVSTQRELAKQHFGITQVIHDILIGTETLADMSLLTRKKLFNTITHLNIDKVLAGYEKLKEELKLNNLLLKTRLSAYQTESEKLITEERRQDVERDLKAVKANIDLIMGIRSDLMRFLGTEASAAAYDQLANVTHAIRTTVDQYHHLFTSYPASDLPRIKTEMQTQLGITQANLQEFYKTLLQKQNQRDSLHLSSAERKAELTAQVEHLQRQIDSTPSRLTFFPPDPTIPERADTALYSAEVNLKDLLEEMLPNSDTDGTRIYTKERYERLIAYRATLSQQLTSAMSLELSITESQNALTSVSGTVNCPACQYSWSIAELASANKHQKEELDAVRKEIDRLKGELARIERSLEELTTYFAQYKRYLSVKSETSKVLSPMWENIDQSGYIFTDPPAILGFFRRAHDDLVALRTLRDCQLELKQLNETLNSLTDSEQINVEQLAAEIDEITDQVSYLQETKIELQDGLRDLGLVENLYTVVKALEDTQRSLKADLRTYHLDHLVKSIILVLDDKLREFKLIHIELENQQHQNELIQATLDRYMDEITDLEENIRVLTLAIDELCPKSGLIAKSISSFINTIIVNVNDTLSRIWNYKMRLVPFDLESGGLNYRFKVEVEDRHSVPDVSVLSKGMKEGVNLSFKLVIYQLLGLEHYPLYLDELASNLDAAHSANMSQLIHTLHASERFSQIFLITHKENFSFLKGIEVIDLS